MENTNRELRELLNKALACLGKEKQSLKDGDVVKNPNNKSIFKILSVNTGNGYGIDSKGNWHNGSGWLSEISSTVLEHATDEEWLNACTKEAEKRGLVAGCDFKTKLGSVFTALGNLKLWDAPNTHGLKFDNSYGLILDYGIWATVITKDKTLEELHDDFWNRDLTYVEYIKANKEAYIKAINNLK